MKPLRSPALLIPAVSLALFLAVAGRSAIGQAPAQASLTILSKDGRRPLPLTISNEQEFVFLDDLALAFQVAIREESLGAFTVTYKGKAILLTPDQPLVSIAGRLVSLPAGPTRAGRRWMVPVEFINRALSLIYDARLDLRKQSRLLVVGDLRVPRVVVRYEAGEPARLVIDATPRTNSLVQQDNATVTVRFEADALDAIIPPIQPQGLVQAIRIVEPATIAVDLGPRFGGFRAAAQPLENATRQTIDLQATSPAEAPAAVPVQPLQTAAVPDLSSLGGPTTGLRTIAIDAGHGGEDEGVKGAGGTTEKDLVLAVARRLKTAIESRLGVRVVLTREDDRNVAIDGRTAIANNNKADLFLSLHANASFRKTVTGASILYAAFDREEEQSAASSLGSERLPTFGGGLRDVDLVLWSRAQIRHIGRSSELAAALEAKFRDRIPLAAHPVDRAPLNVLSSANMPAVLVEIGYLSNEDQEQQMSGAEFQNTLVQAMYDAVLKFRDALGSNGTP